MAVILEDILVEEERPTKQSPELPTLLAALQPPALLPPPHDDRTFVSAAGLDAWRSGMELAVDQLENLMQGNALPDKVSGEVLAAALSRWVPAAAAEEQEGWVLDQRVRAKIMLLLDKLPPPTLLSLRPVFQSTPPPQLSTTSFRALPKPIHNDDVTPEYETWRSTAGWGCWNVLRRGIEGLDAAAPVPIPVLLPPLLTLLDSTHPPSRLRGLHVLETVIDKTRAASDAANTSRGWGGPKGKWLIQTGLGEVLVKSLNTLLLLPNTADAPLPALHSTSLRAHLALSQLLYPRNSSQLTSAIDDLIDRGIVSIYTYRQGGELGPEARENAGWLSNGALWQALGSIGTVRYLGLLLSSLLAPLAELSFTSSRSRAFGKDLLGAIKTMLEGAGKEGGSRVAQWRGKVLDGLGRVWVGVKEAEVLPNVSQDDRVDFESLRELVGEVLRVVRRCAPEVQAQLDNLIRLDRPMFEGLVGLCE